MNIATLCFPFLPRARRLSAREVVLPSRQIWSARLGAGQRVRCVRGVIWLTQSDDATDTILRAGDSFALPRCSHVVAQAMEGQGAVLEIVAK